MLSSESMCIKLVELNFSELFGISVTVFSSFEVNKFDVSQMDFFPMNFELVCDLLFRQSESG